MVDIIIGIVIVVLVACAIRYIVKAKKSGVRCIGCPQAGTCGSKEHTQGSCGSCSCGCHSNE